jgi:hypothetical protein
VLTRRLYYTGLLFQAQAYFWDFESLREGATNVLTCELTVLLLK